MKKKEEFCIMPSNLYYSTKRFNGSERHEVFEGRTGNRQKSIDDGLVVFLTPEQHRGTDGVHGKNGAEFSLYLKKIAEQTWLEYYDKTIDDFIQRYGKNYL